MNDSEPPLGNRTVYLNGRFLPLRDAQVSVLDRGFIFGDGVYELVPVYSRRPFRPGEHLRRLQFSLDGIRLANPYTLDEWQRLVGGIIAAQPEDDLSVYLQITRGVAKRDHAFPAGVVPTVFMMATPLAAPPAAWREGGVTAVSAIDNRWLRCDIKSVSLLANVLLRQLAADTGAHETVMFRDGFLTEGATSNIFVVGGDTLFAPPKSHLMLPGITYDVVLEIAAAEGIPCEVREIAEAEVRAADELWLTSSTREVLPIVELDGRSVGPGVPGPLHARMDALYQEYKRQVMRGAA